MGSFLIHSVLRLKCEVYYLFQPMNNYQQAAQIIKESRLAEDVISPQAIALVIERYVDELIEEINNDPEGFFRDNYRFWRELDKAVLEAERKQQAA